MNTAYVVTGELQDHITIRLNEPVPMDNGEVQVIIELAHPTKAAKNGTNLKQLVVREVSPFAPLSREEAHGR